MRDFKKFMEENRDKLYKIAYANCKHDAEGHCLVADLSKSASQRRSVIGKQVVCENDPRVQAQSAQHDWLTLTALRMIHG